VRNRETLCRAEYSRAYHRDNKDKIRAKSKIYRNLNKERIKNQDLIYGRANRDKKNTQAQKYRTANKEEIKLRGKAYYEKNKKNISIKSKVYYVANREKIKNRHGNNKGKRNTYQKIYRKRDEIKLKVNTSNSIRNLYIKTRRVENGKLLSDIL